MKFPRIGEVLTDSRGNRYRVASCETSAQFGFLCPVIIAIPSDPTLEKKLARILPLPDDPDDTQDAEPVEVTEEAEEAHDLPPLFCPLCRMLLDRETPVPRIRPRTSPHPGFLTPSFMDGEGKAHQHIIDKGSFRYRCPEGHEWDECHSPICPARGCLWGVSESRPDPRTFY